jgi:hypothetical protein
MGGGRTSGWAATYWRKRRVFFLGGCVVPTEVGQ